MDSNIIQTIRRVVSSHPQYVATDRSVKSIMSDLFAGDKAGVNLLVFVYNNGILETVRDNYPVSLQERNRLTKLLVSEYPFPEEKVRWAVDIWCDVLDPQIIQEIELYREENPILTQPVNNFSGSSQLSNTSQISVGVSMTQQPSIRPYTFLGTKYLDKIELFTALAKNWEEGKKQFQRKLLSGYYRYIDNEIAGYIMDAEDAVDNGEDIDTVYFKLLYHIEHGIRGIYWKDKSFSDLSDFAMRFQQAVDTSDSRNLRWFKWFIGNDLLESYLRDTCAIDDVFRSFQAHKAIQKYKSNMDSSPYSVIYALSPEIGYSVNDVHFDYAPDFLRYIQDSISTQNLEALNAISLLLSADDYLDDRLECWLHSVDYTDLQHVISLIQDAMTAKQRIIEENERLEKKKEKYRKRGGIVYFGSYPTCENGDREPICWRVVDVQNSICTLVSTSVLDVLRYSDRRMPTSDGDASSWEGSSLRYWLNHKFLQDSFSSEESAAISISRIITKSDTSEGYYLETDDKVFCLSREEADRYFGSTSGPKRALPTAYAKKHNCCVSDDGNVAWWLRSYSTSNMNAVYRFGNFLELPLVRSDIGVRPAIRIDLASEAFNAIIKKEILLDEEIDKIRKPFITKGQVTTFGSYLQNPDTNETLPLEWKVINYDEQKSISTLICLNAIDCAPYNDKREPINWEECSLRKWLNSEFFDIAFGDTLSKYILAFANDVPSNSSINSSKSQSTTEHVSLLSTIEADNFFESDEERICRCDEHLLHEGFYLNDETHECNWWLRDTGSDNRYASYVDFYGNIRYAGESINSPLVLIRPVIHIKPYGRFDVYLRSLLNMDVHAEIIADAQSEGSISDLADDSMDDTLEYTQISTSLGEVLNKEEQSDLRSSQSANTFAPKNQKTADTEYEASTAWESINEYRRNNPVDISNEYEQFAQDITKGSTVEFGKYRQNDEDIDEPIHWRVISCEDGKALLISEFGIAAKPYNSKYALSPDWQKSRLNKWLNEAFFFDAFSSDEMKYILPDASGNSVFILSADEAECYLPDASDRRCKPTQWAINNGAYCKNGYGYWWLRMDNPPKDKKTDRVSCSGRIEKRGRVPINSPAGMVRPSIWIELP